LIDLVELDATTDVAGQSTMWGSTGRDALARSAAPLRIAVSTNSPAGSQVSLSPARRQSVAEAAALLSRLGHEIVEIDIDYGLASLWGSTVRLLKGVQQDVASLPDPGGLESRTRAVARLGRVLPARSVRRAPANEEKVARSINVVFEDADVVLTPLCESPAPRADARPSRGALRSLRAANTSAWLVPWNATGQPALSVPTGIDADGLPTAIQLAGQANDEATLLALAAQIQAAQPFPRWTGAR
jgi:amidase